MLVAAGDGDLPVGALDLGKEQFVGGQLHLAAVREDFIALRVLDHFQGAPTGVSLD